MKILHVVRDLDPESGGLVSSVLGMATAQSELGHEVKIAATDYGREKPRAIPHVSFFLFHSNFDEWRWSAEMVKRLPFLIKEAHIVHIHGLWDFPVLLAAMLCKKMRKTNILTPHGMLHKTSLSKSALKKKAYLKFFGDSVLGQPNAIHFTSELERQNSKLPDVYRKSFVAPLGIRRLDYYILPNANAFRRRFPELKRSRFILYLGRLHPKKHPEMLIQAFHRSLALKTKILLVMAGSGEPSYVRDLKKMVLKLHMDRKVVFTGMLHHKAVVEAYCAAEMFVLPSSQENFGMSVIEAMAAGCPVVISDLLDLAWDIRKKNAGIVHALSTESLARAILQLTNNQKLCKQMGKNGRRLVLEKFTWDKTIRKLMINYYKVLKKSPYGR